MADIKARAEKMYRILISDREKHLLKIDDYYHGNHDKPYTPPQADDEYKALAERCITNWMPMPVNTVAQSMAVDGFRPGATPTSEAAGGSSEINLVKTPQWDFWQRSRLDARQAAVYRATLIYGHSFVLIYKDKDGKASAKALSPLRTTALFEDPANDEVPVTALYIKSFGGDDEPTTAIVWDETNQYEVSFNDGKASVGKPVPHMAPECPVVRFAAAVDLDGRTVGLVEPMIPLQDRINQTIFDLLIAQSYGSFKVRTITGMAPPMLTEPVYDIDPATNEPRIDPVTGEKVVIGFKTKTDPNTGQPIPAPIKLNSAKILMSEDPDTKFGQLDETPLSGYIESIKLAVQHFSALSQTPPHYMLGEIANISADALNAAEHTLTRKIGEFQNQFGESWERVFRLAMVMEDESGADDHHGEVVWRDLGAQAFAQVADGLGKMADALQIPRRGLWHRVPGVTQNEIATWEELYEQEQPQVAQADALHRAGGAGSIRERLTRIQRPEPPSAAVA